MKGSPLANLLRAIGFRAAYFLPYLLLTGSGYRLIRLTHPERIGHLAGEMDCILKEERLGWAPEQKGLLLAPANIVANARLVDYFERYVRVVRSPLVCRILEPLLRIQRLQFRPDMHGYIGAINQTARNMAIQAAWGDRPPLLSLAPEDWERGEQALERLGLPRDARFVCLHSREGGYSPADEHLHSYRNSRIENYVPAAEALVERGLYCVRMGDPSMRPMPKVKGVVDYANSGMQSDWLDLFLCARCEFFVGNTSGLYFLAQAFGVPCCLANLLPMSASLGSGPHDIGIPKLLWSEALHRYLSFPEVLASPKADYRFSELYRQERLLPVENDAGDIRDLVLEMHDRIEGRCCYSEDDEERQRTFRALMRPGHFSYGSASRVGRDFLRKHENLLA